MATIPLQSLTKGRFLWETLTANDVGEPLYIGGAGGLACAVQLTGTFGGTVTLQGTIDGTNWVALDDTQGTSIAATAAGIYEISTGVYSVRPSAGSGFSYVDVHIRVSRG